jgi:DNA-binding transcriptional LysR family regulator
LWVIPRLPGFTCAHPGVDVRLDASLERRDLRAEGFDIAIRYAALDSGAGRPLFAESMQPVCSPRLRKAGPPLRTPADLAQHTLLRLSDPHHGMPLEWAPWLRLVGLPDLQPLSTLSFSNYNEAIAAALAGQGVALGRRPLVDALLRSRKLVTPFKEETVPSKAYFLIVDAAARARPAVRELERWLLAQAAAGSPAPGLAG